MSELWLISRLEELITHQKLAKMWAERTNLGPQKSNTVLKMSGLKSVIYTKLSIKFSEFIYHLISLYKWQQSVNVMRR